MKYTIKKPQNFWSGLLCVAIGIPALLIAREYPSGSATAMGPGYFPTLLAYILIGLGIAIMATAFHGRGDRIEPFAWRPMVLLSAAFVSFGWAVDHLGFIPALIALIGLCALSIPAAKWTELAVMSAVLILGSLVVFVWALKLPFPLFWW